uniref:Hyaluronidase n=1 Tax=Labrus bergylta TaxID=56723 RepID=A0A3Q3KZI3_9LABR
MVSVVWKGRSCVLLLLSLPISVLQSGANQSPLFEHQPFFVTWNIPDQVCRRLTHSLLLVLLQVPDQFLSLFYTDRLGLYPHVDLKRKKLYNGGIPQRGNLKRKTLDADLFTSSSSSRTSQGLAVIDWEEWRPLWDRNWGTKRIYQTLSVAHISQKNLCFTEEQVAAKSFMSGTLALGRAMRPNYLWGFYLFPNCYNNGWEHPDYTGQCSEKVKRQNDELLWLWESSTALFPSVYLQVSLADNPKAALMVRYNIQEALRVSALPRGNATAPVFVYMRPVFADQNKRFLSQVDLVRTIGESAAVGASGAVMWGASTSCEMLSSYLSSTLNPYITNVTLAAQLCSNFLCRGNGRCVRKKSNSNHYLHLNPENFRTFNKMFTCQCYKGYASYIQPQPKQSATHIIKNTCVDTALKAE